MNGWAYKRRESISQGCLGAREIEDYSVLVHQPNNTSLLTSLLTVKFIDPWRWWRWHSRAIMEHLDRGKGRVIIGLEEMLSLGDDYMIGSKPSSWWTVKGTRVLYPCNYKINVGVDRWVQKPFALLLSWKLKLLLCIKWVRSHRQEWECNVAFLLIEFLTLDDFREQSFSVSKKACPWEKVFSIHLEAGFVCVLFQPNE